MQHTAAANSTRSRAATPSFASPSQKLFSTVTHCFIILPSVKFRCDSSSLRSSILSPCVFGRTPLVRSFWLDLVLFLQFSKRAQFAGFFWQNLQVQFGIEFAHHISWTGRVEATTSSPV